MAAKEGVGAPHNATYPPQEHGVLEERVFQMHGTVVRTDEAVSWLKGRVAVIDERIEKLTEKVDNLSSDLSKLQGSLRTFKWIFGVLFPIATAFVTTIVMIIAKHFGWI